MISKSLINKMSFGEIQAHIKNHNEELNMLTSEANRRAEAVEPHDEIIATISLLEQSIRLLRSGLHNSALEMIQYAEKELTNKLDLDVKNASI